MLEDSAGVAYQDCNGKYRQVRRLLDQAVQDPAGRSRVYEVLFRYGGRCDCTVDRNVVRVPAHLAAVEEEVRKVLAGEDPGELA